MRFFALLLTAVSAGLKTVREGRRGRVAGGGSAARRLGCAGDKAKIWRQATQQRKSTKEIIGERQGEEEDKEGRLRWEGKTAESAATAVRRRPKISKFF